MKQLIPLRLLLNPELHQTLWIWMKLRSLNNRIIYDYSHRTVSKGIGISHTCLSQHVARMIELGWIYMHSGNLCFTSLDKIDVRRQKDGQIIEHIFIPIELCKTKKKQILLFRHAVYWRCSDAQKKRISERREVVKKAESNAKLAPPQLKELQSKGGLAEYDRTIVRYVTLSNKTFGKKVNRSKSTGYNIQKQLREAGLITSISRHKVLYTNQTYESYKYFMNDNLIKGVSFRNGCIWQQLSNEVRIKKHAELCRY